MAGDTTIEWTDKSWNPVRGCRRISPGCEHCYAERYAHRFSGAGLAFEGLTRSGGAGVRWTGQIRLVPEVLEDPLGWRKPYRVFVNSMSDLFHEDVPAEFIHRVFDVMVAAPLQTFQILTKRPDRLLELAPQLPWPANVWMGVSVESLKYTWRIDRLRRVPAAVRFLSLEPLLEPLPNLDLGGIGWAIAGGESGPRARPMRQEWVREIRDQCQRAGIPFFFKQWGGISKKRTGRLLDGRTYDEMPAATRASNPAA